jgi:hypothetical protein
MLFPAFWGSIKKRAARNRVLAALFRLIQKKLGTTETGNAQEWCSIRGRGVPADEQV